MRELCKPLFAALVLATPLFAGRLVLQITSAADNPEALTHNAVLVAKTTACHSPEKTTVTATAEGIENGVRKSIPLKVIPLSAAGTFAVTREWPAQGTWALKLTATNPDYQGYPSGVLIPVEKNTLQWTAAKSLFHTPADPEVAAMLANPSEMARNTAN